MLKLREIVKEYKTGEETVSALAGVSLDFRENEFVSILGPSGCGKTTLLNIVGGLDRYTSGDLIINGKSTKLFKDKDWDTYRNHSVGFVFQSYNLIPHQTVLANVELALTLSGVSKKERRQKAITALQKVGLGDQINKKPNQMSGGQMQRVAIARALVNNPDILLADEPTGALDTTTSVQIMDLLKEVANDRLVIMVTHNPELAEEYSTRIIRLKDGQVVDDTNPISEEETAFFDNLDCERQAELRRNKKAAKKAAKKKSMSFATAISLSMKNLMTKKSRTVLTSFAGSIGIIGIALILAVSTGVTGFINDVQRETLSSFPISIYAEEADLSSMMNTMMETTQQSAETKHDKDAVYSNPILFDLIHGMTSAEVKKNDLKPFKEWLEDSESNGLEEHVAGIHYTYDIDLNMYVKDPNGEYTKADIAEIFESLMGNTSSSSSSSSMMTMSNSFSSFDVWCELIPGTPKDDGSQELIGEMIKEQYELVEEANGRWPAAKNEVVLVLNKNNEISDLALYTLGYITKDDMIDTIMKALGGDETYVSESKKIEYSDIIGKSYKLILNDAYYSYNPDTKLYDDVSNKEEVMKMKIEGGYDVTITGIIRPKEDAKSTVLSGTLAYTHALTDYVITETLKTELAKAQLDEKNANINVFTGLPFVADTKELSDAEKLAELNEYISDATTKEKAELYKAIMGTPSDKYVDDTVKMMKDQFGLTSDIENDKEAEEALREKLAELLSKQEVLGGMNSESILAYMKNQSVAEIEKMLDSYLRESVITSYRQAQEEKINAEAAIPSAEDVVSFKEMIKKAVYANMATQFAPPAENSDPAIINAYYYTVHMAYLTSVYSQQTGLAPESIGATLATLPQEEINSRFDAICQEEAYAQYEKNVKPTEEQLNEKIAGMLTAYMASASDATKLSIYEKHMPDGLSVTSYDDNLKLIGICDPETPSEVHIYANTFEDKDEINALIDKYNEGKPEEGQISYTDYVAMLMSSVTTIINAISYVLIAFVAISLVVSSVMIGIITNISVLERTKEIGILRAIGASKKDISRVFNAETFIIGLAAGLLGIVTTVILCFPINAIIAWVTTIDNITASLNPIAAVILVLISLLLTIIAGIIPAKKASKKDPVVALRTE